MSIKVMVPSGAFGKSPFDSELDSLMRAVGAKFGDPGSWPDKYGATFENDEIVAHEFCWCEQDDCPFCREENPEPNFRLKQTGLEVRWYKYIGRGMETNRQITEEDVTLLRYLSSPGS